MSGIIRDSSSESGLGSMLSSRFVHVVACVRIPFLLRLNNIPFYVSAASCFFFRLSGGGS